MAERLKTTANNAVAGNSCLVQSAEKKDTGLKAQQQHSRYSSVGILS